MRQRTCYCSCPAYPLTDDAHRRQCLATACEIAHALAWRLVPSPLLDRHPGPGRWLPTHERHADLERALGHDIWWPARGGYGCLDLVPALCAATPASPPLLIGFSDITVLHALWARRGWGESLYAAMPGVEVDARAYRTLAALATGAPCAYGPAASPAAQVMRGGHARGPCFAACLSVLAGLVGTPAMPDLSGRVLILEDIDERPYRLDRALQQLHLAGCLTSIAALIGGRFPCEVPGSGVGPSTAAIWQAWADRLGVPSLLGLAVGHDPAPLALANGRELQVDLDTSTWRLAFAARR